MEHKNIKDNNNKQNQYDDEVSLRNDIEGNMFVIWIILMIEINKISNVLNCMRLQAAISDECLTHLSSAFA